MRPRREETSEVARRMAALSAELAALRQHGQDAEQEGDVPQGAAREGAGGEDDRWARWWPEPAGTEDRAMAGADAQWPVRPEPADRPADDFSPDRGRHARTPSRGGLLARAGDLLARAAGPDGPADATRWATTPVHLALGALAVALALGGSAWWVASSQPEPVPDGSASTVSASATASTSEPGVVPPDRTATPEASDSGATPGPAVGAEPSNQSAVVVVHVAGKVRHPGIQALPLGARVADAVSAAGGPRPGVSLTSLNLARRLSDGEQVLVGLPGGGPTSAPAGDGTPAVAGASPDDLPVSINTADATTLETLPGVGPVTAAAIIGHREEHGPFTSVDQLLDVSGIGEVTLARIAPHATL